MFDLKTINPDVMGVKALVFIGEEILVYRRDSETTKYPNHIDLPGGGIEAGESPLDCVAREIKEEFDLTIHDADIVYAARYPSLLEPGKVAVFVVIKLSAAKASNIKIGDEITNYELMTLERYLGLTDAWPTLQTRTRQYLESLNQSERVSRER